MWKNDRGLLTTVLISYSGRHGNVIKWKSKPASARPILDNRRASLAVPGS
jgi:hypothetical protein